MSPHSHVSANVYTTHVADGTFVGQLTDRPPSHGDIRPTRPDSARTIDLESMVQGSDDPFGPITGRSAERSVEPRTDTRVAADDPGPRRNRTPTMMPDNDYYGHRTAMARYCGLKQLSPAVFGSIRHGWQPGLGDIGERRITAAPIFVWNEREEREAEARRIPNVVAIGAPFLYAVASLAAGSVRPPAGRGTIVFPMHSDGTIRVSQDCERLVAETEASEQGPFTVSVFYQDLDRPDMVEPFERAGWRMVTFGSRDDPQFLPRLVLELEAHAAVVSDAVCSAIWYGAHLGRHVRVMGARPQVTTLDGQRTDLDHAEQWPQVHGDGIEGAAAVALAADELGVSSMREPAELARLLGWTSWRRRAAPLVRLAIDARHGNDLRLGRETSRSVRRSLDR